MELNELLPNDRRYFTYMGSLTTPPCSEGVKWIVMRQPVTLTKDQIDIFARMYPMNARPIQAASGRRIMQSN
jgi:carbonic anhydrase